MSWFPCIAPHDARLCGMYELTHGVAHIACLYGQCRVLYFKRKRKIILKDIKYVQVGNFLKRSACNQQKGLSRVQGQKIELDPNNKLSSPISMSRGPCRLSFGKAMLKPPLFMIVKHIHLLIVKVMFCLSNVTFGWALCRQ